MSLAEAHQPLRHPVEAPVVALRAEGRQLDLMPTALLDALLDALIGKIPQVGEQTAQCVQCNRKEGVHLDLVGLQAVGGLGRQQVLQVADDVVAACDNRLDELLGPLHRPLPVLGWQRGPL